MVTGKIDFSKIVDYFVSMKIVEGINILEVKFPSEKGREWQVFDDKENLVFVETHNKGKTHLVFSEKSGTSFEDLINHVTKIVDTNLEIQEKYDLYQERVKELTELFKTLPLKTLKTLNIRYRKPRVKKEVVKEEKEVVKEEPTKEEGIVNEEEIVSKTEDVKNVE